MGWGKLLDEPNIMMGNACALPILQIKAIVERDEVEVNELVEE
ncbi:hypothetical protein [Chlorogloeopsis fritschii]|nr:hypothetical protein [Chlorogloeopsis fritschii]